MGQVFVKRDGGYSRVMTSSLSVCVRVCAEGKDELNHLGAFHIVWGVFFHRFLFHSDLKGCLQSEVIKRKM